MASLRSVTAMVMKSGLIVSLTIGLSGCGKKPVTPIAKGPGPTPATKSIGKPISEEEAAEFAEQIKQAVDSGDAAALDRLIDWSTLYDRSTSGGNAPEPFRQGFIKGLAQSQTNGKGISSGIIAAAQKGGSYRLLRNHTRENRPWLLFRILLPDQGVNYHDLLLARRADGKVKAIDIHVFMSGELLSQTFRRAYLQIAAQQNAGFLEKLTGSDQKIVNSYVKLGEMAQATRSGQFAPALEIYRTLAPEVQKEKSVLLVRLQAAQNLGDAEYTQAMEQFRQAHPDDTCIDILSIDYYFIKKRYAEAMACIDRVDRALGGDPYLETMRAGVFLEQNDPAAARASLHRAMAADSSLVDLYWSLINVSLKEKNFDETLQTLRTIRDKFHMEIADLKTVPLYKDFIGSPQYQEWLKESQPATAKPVEKTAEEDRPKD